MTYHGKTQLTLTIIAPPDQVAEGDRLFKKPRGLDGGYALPYRRESSSEL
jgi:hypothetical protein